MLLSGAIIAATASRYFTNMEEAMRAMTHHQIIIYPQSEAGQFYDKKYAVFLEMYEDQIKYRRMMN